MKFLFTLSFLALSSLVSTSAQAGYDPCSHTNLSVIADNKAGAQCLEPYPGEVSDLTNAQKAQIRACAARLYPGFYRAAKQENGCR